MTNNSASGGYLSPSTSQPLPGSLTLAQFIQTVLVGISGIPGQFVRPRWQIAPAGQPDISVDWLAFGVQSVTPTANSWVGVDDANVTISQRHETLSVQCAFYGPNAEELAAITRDGFFIQQNLEALRSGNMGLVEVSAALHVPDLVNERYVNRMEMEVVLRREIQRSYPILGFLSASGTIHTVLGNESYLLPWDTANVK